jgi:phage-related minor tail protein
MYKVDDYTSLVQLDKAIWSLWKSIVHGELEGYPVLSSIMGIGSSVLGGVSGGAAASSGTAISDYGSNFQFNAKGGVYSSSDLSAYSGQVVDNPTFFAFAKGAGVMGEAGPEAIMPLTRAADGSLAVRAVSGAGTGGDAAPRVYITIDGNGNTSTQAPSGLEKFGADVGRFVDQRYKQNVLRDIRPGGDIWNAMKGTR